MRQLLLISYYFPPCGGAAVQRWIRLISELTKNQVRITVLCPDTADYPEYDESLLQKIPSSVRIIRTPSWSINRLWSVLRGKDAKLPHGELSELNNGSWYDRLILWIRLNIIIPDIRILWNYNAFSAAKNELSINKYDAVVTTAPPHSTHLVGYKLQKKYGIKWLADFRDPWTKIHYLQLHKPMLISRYIHERMEKRIVRSANVCLVVSENILKELPRGNKFLLYNGFDHSDFDGMTYQQTDVFRIKYIGKLTAGQDIMPFLEMLDESILDRPIEFSFIGTNLSPGIRAQIANLMHSDKVKYVEHLPHRDSIFAMVQSELLILIINNSTNNLGIITTKLFEYAGSKTMILCFGPANGEAAQIISDYSAGKCFDYYDVETSIEFIEMLYESWQVGSDIKNNHSVNGLSSAEQTKLLLDLIDSL